MDLPIHTIDSAPEGAKPPLRSSQEQYRFVRTLHGVMAEAPVLLAAYRALGDFWSHTSLSVLERQIVLLTINQENACHYWTPRRTYHCAP